MLLSELQLQVRLLQKAILLFFFPFEKTQKIRGIGKRLAYLFPGYSGQICASQEPETALWVQEQLGHIPGS